MIRVALAFVLVLAGCDRVFGLIGDDTGPTRDGSIDASDDDADAIVAPPFCLTNAVNALFCADFDTDIGNAFGDFSILEVDGNVTENQERAVSVPQSARAELKNDPNAEMPPRAVLSHSITLTGQPAHQFEFDMYSEEGASDVVLFTVTSGATRLALRSSGLLTWSGAGAASVSSLIPRARWVHVEIEWMQAQGELRLVVDHSPPVVSTGMQTLAGTTEIVSLGLQESTATERSVVFYDNLLVR